MRKRPEPCGRSIRPRPPPKQSRGAEIIDKRRWPFKAAEWPARARERSARTGARGTNLYLGGRGGGGGSRSGVCGGCAERPCNAPIRTPAPHVESRGQVARQLVARRPAGRRGNKWTRERLFARRRKRQSLSLSLEELPPLLLLRLFRRQL